MIHVYFRKQSFAVSNTSFTCSEDV